ncbi:MAG: mevalonate 5-phosphate dehydratase large subunit [Methanoculleus sp.]|nr:mevalonate 5-phosphate dehydratase large subunit [Methanoculleus sp.]
MYLDNDDEKVLAGEFGETRRKMMEILVALGRVYEAEKLVPIASAQVSGASYKTIGKWGLAWLQSLNARVAVPTVLNPIGMPREGWQEFGIGEEFARRQTEVVEAYRRLGIKIECTCTPYYLRITEYGEHLAWSESSAVAYANSVLGARTNREGGPSALAAAIVGKTPYYGLHLVENRRPQVVVEVESGTGPHPNHWGAIGHVAGKKVGNRIPIFSGIRPGRDHLKALGAAMAATGAVALFHVDKITPEARVFSFDTGDLDRVTVSEDEVEALFAETEVEAVAVGCPHCSTDELRELAELLRGKATTKPFYIFAAKGVAQNNPDLVGVIERSGARVIPDTCMVVSPRMDEFKSIMVDSGKALAYVPGMCGALARIGTRKECVEVATS